jgi:hypothetical protein
MPAVSNPKAPISGRGAGAGGGASATGATGAAGSTGGGALAQPARMVDAARTISNRFITSLHANGDGTAVEKAIL